MLVLEAAPEEESGGNSRFTAGAIRVVYDGVDDIKTLVPDLTPAEIASTDFGTYTAAQFFDDMARVTAVSHRSRPRRASGHAQLRDARLDARQGRALHSDLRPAGVQGRRPVQVLGRAHGRGGRRRAGPRRHAHRTRRKSAASSIRYGTRALELLLRRQPRRGRARAPRRRGCRSCAQRRWCSPAAASRPMRNGARAISAPAGTSPRCAARASTPATASAWRSAIGAAPCGNWSGCHAVQWDMQRARVRRPRGRRSVPEALLSVRHHGQRATASASSTRAPISATTPTPSTAA